MEEYFALKKIVDYSIVYSLFPMIITLIILRKFLKSKVNFNQIFNMTRWFIVGYTIINFVIYFIGMTIEPEGYAFINRATGPYALAYWIMLIGAIVFPLSLIIKKSGLRPWYLLLVCFMMNIGFYLERFTIIITSIHRDYLPDNWEGFSLSKLFGYSFLVIWLQGVILALLFLGIFKLINFYSKENIIQ